jgi:hypothetical protein
LPVEFAIIVSFATPAADLSFAGRPFRHYVAA